MLNRRVYCFLLLTCLISAGCRERWRETYRGVGYARSRGYTACVDSPGHYLPPPEQLLRAESRELRDWYRELDVAGRKRQYGRGRVRGRIPRGAGGFEPAYGEFHDGYYGDMCETCGHCGDCGDCGDFEMGYGCGGVPIELGCNGPFPMMNDGWTSYSGGGDWGGDYGGYSGEMSSRSCPTCGQWGPAYQMSPDQVVPHGNQGQQYQYMPPLQQVPPAPTYDNPPGNGISPTPAPPPAAPAPPQNELAPTVPEPMPSPVEQTYFAPPLR